MQINMPDSGTFLFISDHCHVIENVSPVRPCSATMPCIPCCTCLAPICSSVATYPSLPLSTTHTHKHRKLTNHLLSTKQWRDGIPQGWLARDHPAWFRSTQRLKQLERTTRGVVVSDHDKTLFENLIAKGTSYT